MREKVMNHDSEHVDDVQELDDFAVPVAFTAARLQSFGLLEREVLRPNRVSWRMKERMRTTSVALVLCLNVGVDPPDVLKTQPCAKLECWIDPYSMAPQKALEAIGNNLQKQYERWQPKARYKQSLDPTVEDVKKFCTSLRRNAKEDRVLFHYNGHGVPKPTINGEIWVFNKHYTQYIPLSLYDLQQWVGFPSIYVYDCSNAGLIVQTFNQFASQHEREWEIAVNATKSQGHCDFISPQPPQFKNCIQLAACGADQILPMNPDLPADLFTSCLTTPLKIAFCWFIMQNSSKLLPGVTPELIEKIPGSIGDRRTMLGELNWIFTAITDTIAWNVLPRDVFQRLFRQDLLVASLFRNFLLADRIMRSYNCTPCSSPKLPPTYHHPMWQAWDLAVDNCLHQLPSVLADPPASYRYSSFFSDQLTAFQVWLSLGVSIDPKSNLELNYPEQLPIVLQVLLSQVHRSKALELLGRFLDLGPWAVNMALSVGIFPYVLRLLQSTARELRPLLVFIWAKILAVDESCQEEIIRDPQNGHKYFLGVLCDTNLPSQYRTMAAFVMACIVRDYQPAQEAAHQGSIIAICLEQLTDPNQQLRQWLTICLGLTWNNYDAARWCGVRDSAHEKIYSLLSDDTPEVRASAVFALGTFITSAGLRTDHANTIDHSIGITLINAVSHDGSTLVRKELVVALQWLVLLFETQISAVSYQLVEEEKIRELNNYSNQVYNTHLTDGPSHETPPSNISGLRKVASRDRLMKLLVSPGSAFNTQSTTAHVTGDSLTPPAPNYIHNTVTAIKRISSTSSLSTFALGGSQSSIGNVYSTIWKAVLALGNDPHPDVASMAQVIIDHIKSRVQPATAISNDSLKETKSEPSSSEPSSPANHPSFVMSESPPSNSTNMTNSKDPPDSAYQRTRPRPSSEGLPCVGSNFQQNTLTTASTNNVSGRLSAGSNTALTFTPFPRKRKIFGRDPNSRISEDNSADGLSNSLSSRFPLVKTDFVRWCIKHFNDNCVKFLQNNDPESLISKEKEWRVLRNHYVKKSSREELATIDPSRIEEQIFLQKNSCPPSLLLFHPFEPHLIVAERESFSLWLCDNIQSNSPFIGGYNQSTPCLLGTFSNANTSSTRITSAQLVNPHDISILLLSCDDASVRAWKIHTLQQDNSPPQLVTAFQIFADMYPLAKASGTLIKWNQNSCHLIGAGEYKVIRIWDAEKESVLMDINSHAESSVTSLTSDGSNLICAGFQDGVIRVFDQRLSSSDAKILTFRDHNSAIVNSHLYADTAKHVNILSASTDGVVKFWDKRLPSAIKTISIPQGITAMDVHSEADVFAYSTSSQNIHVFTLDGFPGSVIKYPDGFMSQKMAPISCLAFHPFKVSLAAGRKDSYISIYSSPKAH